jgi:pyruvate/2-oxoglutarate dehydrogenase complex dihydrolipoamide acyltransferase (E2) component
MDVRLSGPASRQRQQLASAIERVADDAAGDDIRARLSALEDAVGLGVDATDEARELALEHGIDLAALEGSGQDGRVLVGDVEDAVDGED